MNSIETPAEAVNPVHVVYGGLVITAHAQEFASGLHMMNCRRPEVGCAPGGHAGRCILRMVGDLSGQPIPCPWGEHPETGLSDADRAYLKEEDRQNDGDPQAATCGPRGRT